MPLSFDRGSTCPKYVYIRALAHCAEMVWMETFCFYFSVRLGVIVSSIISLFQEILSLGLFVAYGPKLFNTIQQLVEQSEQQNQDYFILKLVYKISERPPGYIAGSFAFFAFHILACFAASYGSFKLKKYFLLPYMITQLIVCLLVLIQHIVLMVILKKIVNLGLLIGMTLSGGFYILFIGYSWAAGVAMFQIINLVKSQRYKALYGEDPMSPSRERTDILPRHGTVENVNIFLTPNDCDISAIKRKRLIEEQQRKRFGREIISVIPLEQAEKMDNDDMVNFDYWHWNELVGARRGGLR